MIETALAWCASYEPVVETQRHRLCPVGAAECGMPRIQQVIPGTGNDGAGDAKGHLLRDTQPPITRSDSRRMNSHGIIPPWRKTIDGHVEDLLGRHRDFKPDTRIRPLYRGCRMNEDF